MRTLILFCIVAAAAGSAAAQTRPAAQRPKPAAPPARPAEAPAAVLARADEALAAKRIEEAARLYASVAERGDSVRALLGLARIHSGRGNPREAIQTLERARALAPNSEEVLSAFARVALAARAPVTSILTLEPLARMLPGVMEYHYLLGVALMQAGDMPNAVIALQEATALEPNRSVTLVALGLAYNSQKLYDEARVPLMRSLEIEPDNLEGLAALAEAQEGSGDPVSAEMHAERVLARQPGDSIANVVMGLVRMKQERYQEARGFFERAVATDPLSGKAHYQLSLACARLGDDAGQQKHLALYQSVQREVGLRLLELRSATGASKGGMSP